MPTTATSTPPSSRPRTGSPTRASLARLYAGLIGGVDGGPSDGLLTREQIDIARALQTSGFDQVLSFPGFDVESTIALGFWSTSPFAPMGGAGTRSATTARGAPSASPTPSTASPPAT